MSSKARETKANMKYWDFIKIQSFCTAKETVNKTKRQPTEWDEIFANVLSDKGLVSKIYKELIRAALVAQRFSTPAAQGVILETRDGVPCRAPCMELASPSANVSAILFLSLALS